MSSIMSDDKLRRLQLKELEILKAVRDVCKKNGLTYYLDSGTLLGAVRHQGFIPWDDDVDIVMPYTDYRKFLTIAQEELGEKYFVQNAETDPNYYCAFTKVRLNNTTMMPVMHRKYHIHHGIWIDVFPLVHIQKKHVGIKRNLIQISNALLMKDYIAANKKEFIAILGQKKYIVVRMIYCIPYWIRFAIHQLIVKAIVSAKKGDSVATVWTSITSVYPKEFFTGPPKMVEFEGEMFCAPNKYIDCLKLHYGDYMKLPTEEERVAHGSLIVDFNRRGDYYLR